jgi:transposase
MAQSPEKVRPAFVQFLDDAESGVTACARETFSEWYEQLTELDSRIERVTHRVERVYRAYPVCQKLAAVSGIGPLTATALVATVGRPQACHNGRHLAAWLGLVPRQYSSGGKERFGGISKRGSRYGRTLLIHGARAVVPRAERRTDTPGRWLCALTHRKGTHVAAVAFANKNARVIWALLAHDEVYRQPA